MDNNVTLFTALTVAIAAAVVLQMLILLAMYLAMRKLGARMEALADRLEDTSGIVQRRVLPLLDGANSVQQDVKSFLATARPKVDTVLDNLSYVTATARSSVERMDATVNDAIDRVRLQVIRGDEMLTRTMDRVEETTERVQHTVMSPVRQLSGLVQGLSVGFGTFFNSQRRRRNGGPSDEMFI